MLTGSRLPHGPSTWPALGARPTQLQVLSGHKGRFVEAIVPHCHCAQRSYCARVLAGVRVLVLCARAACLLNTLIESTARH